MAPSSSRHAVTRRLPESSDAAAVSLLGRQFQRTYQACQHCRKRKVRCIPEDDGASMLTCVKCRRERRVCVFTQERRIQSIPNLPAGGQASRRTVGPVTDISINSASTRAVPRHSELHDSSGTNSSVQEEARPSTEQGLGHVDDRDGWQDCLIEGVIESSITNQKDALNLLYKAVEHEGSNHGAIESEPSQVSPASPDHSDLLRYNDLGPKLPSRSTEQWCSMRYQISKPQPHISDMWRACPFVVQRWMTPPEAVTWVDLFFQNMAILSPVMDDFYKSHENHHILIEEEPILCSIILMLSCRYHHLAGDGSLSRGFLLHERLWNYCQSLMNQIWWGEERKGRPRMRTVGTIQSLLLLAEWHPRPFHLSLDFYMLNAKTEDPTRVGNVSTGWYEGVLEPVRKSNRMSWMLLGSAVTLSHEIGLFGETASKSLAGRGPEMTESVERLKRLLFIFINNVISRLGCQVPKVPLFHTSILTLLDSSTWTNSVEWKDWMTSWIDLTRIIRSSSEILFTSEQATKEIVQDGRYPDLLDHFGHVLDRPEVRRDMIFIDYQYVRIYIMSLAMQGIAVRRKNRLDSVLSEHIFPQDHDFVRQVLEGSKVVLERVLKLSGSGYLKYLPVRVHIQIASTAVYLIKALALDTQTEELNNQSLDLLEQTAQKLRSDTVDDIYLTVRFASLIDTHAQVLRRRLRPTLDMSSVLQRFSSATARPGAMTEIETTYYDQLILGDDWLTSELQAPFSHFFEEASRQSPFNYHPDGFQYLMRDGVIPPIV